MGWAITQHARQTRISSDETLQVCYVDQLNRLYSAVSHDL